MQPLAAGATFGPYRLLRLLGQGGFAQVWEAERVETGRRLALKVLTELRATSAHALERFQLEGRLTASLSHPRCVYVFAAEEIEGYPAISMELMPGGTLADRLARGPLPVEEAVDAVLDVLDGLEAAHQAGIIHRDIKPSNCFLDEAGGVKVGDFGISKSLETDAGLTATGSIVGTPYYAAPEQIGGEPLDLRTDLYSVGAMLYELVTGKPPFAGANPGQVLAQVLTKDPTPFAAHGVEVPRGLQRVVLRLLSKPKEKRYPSYAALRAALVPFSSRSQGPAELARRFAAIVLDMLLFLVPGLIAGLGTLARAGSVQALAVLGMAILRLGYFSLMEGILGWTLGKRLLGLRVVARDGGPASLRAAFLRAAVFLLVFELATIATHVLALLGAEFVTRGWFQALSQAVVLLSIGALLSTMRTANGFAGLHELASGTRTVAVRRVERAQGGPGEAETPLAPPSGPSVYGPYRPQGERWRRGEDALVVARDDELGRSVWIHAFRDPGTARPVARLAARRAGSLPWLQRSRADGVEWDAYGAPSGAGLLAWVRDHGPLEWKELREVLASVAAELAARFAADGTAGPLSPAQVWVDGAGHAVLLDFPAERPAPEAIEVTPARWREFVREVVALAITGRPPQPGAPPLSLASPMPGHARETLARLWADDGGYDSPAELAETLAAARAFPAELTRWRRWGPILLPGLAPAVFLAMVLAAAAMLSRLPPWIGDLSRNLGSYAGELRRVESLTALRPDTSDARTARSIEILIAAAHAEATRTKPTGDAILQQIPESLLAVVETAVARHPSPSPAEVEAARAWVAARLPDVAVSPRVSVSFGSAARQVDPRRRALFVFRILGVLAIPAVLLALALRGNLLFHLFRIEIQRTDGRRAERWRCFLRALLAWGPLLVWLFADLPGWAEAGLIGLWLLGVAWAMAARRGPADRLTGTVLMPK